jgi:hypothetical protein
MLIGVWAERDGETAEGRQYPTHLVVTGFESVPHDDFAAVVARWVQLLLLQAVALRRLLRILIEVPLTSRRVVHPRSCLAVVAHVCCRRWLHALPPAGTQRRRLSARYCGHVHVTTAAWRTPSSPHEAAAHGARVRQGAARVRYPGFTPVGTAHGSGARGAWSRGYGVLQKAKPTNPSRSYGPLLMAVLLETSKGDLVIDLFVDECPIASKNFLKLCKCVPCREHTQQPSASLLVGRHLYLSVS